MKTDLTGQSSLFRKSQSLNLSRNTCPTDEAPDKSDYTDIDDLVSKISLAIANRDVEQLPWLQLELQTRSLIMLNMIDWKMWEIYSKFVGNN